MRTRKKAAGRKAKSADRERSEIEIGCAYVAPRTYWAVWALESHAPPCLAGTKVDADDLRDDDEIALPLVVVSPEWLDCEVRQLVSEARDLLAEASKQPGYSLTGPVQRAAGRLAVADVQLQRAVGQ